MGLSKQDFIKRNWDGENRWRRAELNDLARSMDLELYDTDSNKNVFDRILLHLTKKQEYKILKQKILSNELFSQLFTDFINQLPNKEYMCKMYPEIDYNYFIKSNKYYFFTQTQPSFDFLSYILNNQVYQIYDTFATYTNCIFFHINGNYTIMNKTDV